jgi:hypothetical protein
LIALAIIHAGLIIGAVLLSGIFIPMTAIAAKDKTVSFEQYTYELVPGMSQSLRGVDASVTCPNGDTVSGPLFDFSANKAGHNKSGNWGMLAAPGAALGDTGAFDKVLVTKKHFKLQGSWEGLFGRDNAVTCFDASLPATVVIEGQCGLGTVINFKASNEVTGSFKGDITCN